MAEPMARRRTAATGTGFAAPAGPPPPAIIELTAVGIVSGSNLAAELLYGYPAAELVGRALDVLCPSERRAVEAEILQQIIAEGRTEQYEADRVCKDGTVITVSLTAAPIAGPAGAVVGITIVSWEVSPQGQAEPGNGIERRDARDVREQDEVTADTERRDARDARERKDRLQVQQAQRLESLGQLAGGVAHDFNNLLAVILNYVSFAGEELAATGPDPSGHLEAASADLAQVTIAVERAARLTRQLLTFARREVARPQVLDLDKVITGVEEMLRRTLGEHVELVTSLAGALWPVLADPGQLEQVLVNLAVNARDAMPAGGTLTIDTGNIIVDADTVAGGSMAREGRNVRLRVSDTGTGMTADVAERVFEPFFTTKAEGAGTGLGLATVYGILSQAEGHIRIYSEPGTGTTFTIMLPVTAEAPAPVVKPEPHQRVPQGETVLVVEDEPALREVTRRILARNGYTVITAANGPEALGIARDHPGEIHLLVTDVVMPHMLGKEVAASMRAIRPGIEVLFMSGYARPVLAAQGRLDPRVALVEKPFSEADLMAKAGQVLDGHFHGLPATGQPVE